MFTIENLTVSYRKDKQVLNGLSLSLETGLIHGLAGLNGEGKTTLLNAIYRFIRPDSGTILFNGQPLTRREVAYLEAENYFYPYITGREYLSLFAGGKTAFPLDDWQKLFSLPLDELIDTYSTGMRKRLALLAVIKQDKPLLILDEPFNGLDLEASHLLLLILDRLLRRQKTVLITSHLYESLTNCCDYIHYLSGGLIRLSCDRERFPLLKEELQSRIEQRSSDLLDRLF